MYYTCRSTEPLKPQEQPVARVFKYIMHADCLTCNELRRIYSLHYHKNAYKVNFSSNFSSDYVRFVMRVGWGSWITGILSTLPTVTFPVRCLSSTSECLEPECTLLTSDLEVFIRSAPFRLLLETKPGWKAELNPDYCMYML